MSTEDLKRHLILASDALRGRETGLIGHASYFAEQFRNIGFSGPVQNGANNDYYQPVHLYRALKWVHLRVSQHDTKNALMDQILHILTRVSTLHPYRLRTDPGE